MAITYKAGNRLVAIGSFSDDFSGSDNWTETGSDVSANTTTDKLVVKMDRTSTNNKCVYDLGAGNVSNVNWVLRYHRVKFSVVGASNAMGYSGISDSGTGTASSGSQDFIGLLWNDNGEVGRYGTVYANGSALPSLNNTGSYQVDFTPTVGVNYYVEIERLSTTQMIIRFYSDAFKTKIFEIYQDISSAVVSLRYLTFQNYASNTSDTPIEFTVDKVEFFNESNNIKGVVGLPSADGTNENGSTFADPTTGREFILQYGSWRERNKPADSIGELLNDYSGARKQRFWDFFSGSSLDARWTHTDYLTSNHTGSGMVDEVDGGFKLVGNSSAPSQNALISFNDKRPFSNTGSAVIWVAKMVTSGTNKQGGWGMCGVMPSYWMDGLKINAPTGTGNYGFYTMNATEAQTQIANVSNTTSWKTYKLEQLDGSANCSVDGVLEATRTANMSRYKMQPFLVSKYNDSDIRARYCEAYNT